MKHILATAVIVLGWFIFQPCSWWIVFTICLAIEAHRFATFSPLAGRQVLR